MAKVSIHGPVIGTVEYVLKARRYMADGVILQDDRTGWKLAGRVKAGVSPTDAYARAKARLGEKLAAAPALAAYRERLHRVKGRARRACIHQAVVLMPADPDGVLSIVEADFPRAGISLADIEALCDVYREIKVDSPLARR
jgi:hypothetical protein